MISTRGRYALRLLADLAEQDSDRYVTLREIAERQEISEKYLENIVKDLVRAGFVEGVRGKGGGYRLSRSAEELNVLEILQLMEGTLAPVACLEAGAASCPRAPFCKTLPMWSEYYELTRSFFYGKKLSDLLEAGTPTSAFDPMI